MNNGVMCDYFDYKGTRYYTGSKFKCKNFIKKDILLFPEIEITFIKYNKKSDICFIHSNIAACDFMFLLDVFMNNIVSVIAPKTRDVVVDRNKVYKNNKEYYHWVEDGEDCYKQKPDCLLIGWMWYVFIMGIAVIFNGRLFIWALATYTFVKWRKKKIKEG